MPTRIRKDDGTYIDADDVGTEGAAVPALTDSSGGSANTTMTAVGGLVTLTDSTGQSATHDDILAATTIPTISATNPTAPTAYSAVTDMTAPVTKAEGEAVSAALATLRSEVATYETAISALVVDVAAILAVITVMAQNQSDAGQKVIEIVSDLEDVKNNFADLNGQINNVITNLEGGGSLTAN